MIIRVQYLDSDDHRIQIWSKKVAWGIRFLREINKLSVTSAPTLQLPSLGFLLVQLLCLSSTKGSFLGSFTHLLSDEPGLHLTPLGFQFLVLLSSVIKEFLGWALFESVPPTKT